MSSTNPFGVTPSERVFLRKVLAEIFGLFRDYAISSIELRPILTLARPGLSFIVVCNTAGSRANTLRKQSLAREHQRVIDGKGAADACEKRLSSFLATGTQRELELVRLFLHPELGAWDIHHCEQELGQPIDDQCVDPFLKKVDTNTWAVVLEPGAREHLL